jgi:hypothetical protein
VNYGIRPDGSKDFPELPGFETKSHKNIMIFGVEKKCRTLGINLEISHYIGQQRVDGFRYDMAEMVPYEFWSYMNSAIKVNNQMLFYWRSV